MIIFLVLFGFFYFKLYNYLTFENLETNKNLVQEWYKHNPFISILFYILLFTGCVIAMIPAAWFFVIMAGLLFGIIPGSCYALLSINLGTIIYFYLIKKSLPTWLLKKSEKWIKQVEQGFKKNSFQYLLFLRVVPIFPSWFVNLVSALMKVPLSIFITATLLGNIPFVLFYASIGYSLDRWSVNNLILPLLSIIILIIFAIIHKKRSAS